MAQQVQDKELKEKISRDQTVQMLHKWVDALDKNQDFQVQVKGESCTIPADALNRGKMEVEYEIDEGEYEFELKLKWR